MAHFTDFPKGVSVMVFNSTFYNISVISWQSVLLVEETGVSSENQQPVASHWKTLSHNVVWSTPCHEWDFPENRLLDPNLE